MSNELKAAWKGIFVVAILANLVSAIPAEAPRELPVLGILLALYMLDSIAVLMAYVKEPTRLDWTN